jgi:hypothetical protein
MKALINFVAGTALALGAATAASATVVNLDAKVDRQADGGTVFLELNAGKYSVSPFDNTGAGGFDAWNAWSRTTCNDEGVCTRGWLTNYAIRIGNGDTMDFRSGVFKTPELALENAVTATFTLDEMETVAFFINDSNFRDNKGGVSLQVSEVPLPAGVVLLLTGVGGLAIAKRRNKA